MKAVILYLRESPNFCAHYQGAGHTMLRETFVATLALDSSSVVASGWLLQECYLWLFPPDIITVTMHRVLLCSSKNNDDISFFPFYVWGIFKLHKTVTEAYH